MDEKKGFGLGVTLYSFNIDYYMYKYTLEEMMEKVASLGPNQGIEIVAPILDRGFPDLSAEFEHRFKNGIEKYGLVPTCYGGYPDPERYYGRFSTDDEELEYTKSQIRAAAKLGFTVCRCLGRRHLYEKVVSYAEKYKIKMVTEVHAPMSIETSTEMLNAMRALNSEYVGIVPDSGAFCQAPSAIYLKRFAEQGVSKEISDKIVEMWYQKAKVNEITEAVKAMGGGELEEMMATESCMYFGHSDPHIMAEVMPLIHHVHGKFFHMDENGNEKAVRMREVVDTLVENGYNGYMSSEYEGHHWYTENDAFEQVKRHQALVKSYFK